MLAQILVTELKCRRWLVQKAFTATIRSIFLSSKTSGSLLAQLRKAWRGAVIELPLHIQGKRGWKRYAITPSM